MVDIPSVWSYTHDMTKKKTHEEFISQIKSRLDEYEVLSRYDGATKKIKFKHKKCGNVFEMKPMHFVYGEGCRLCGYKKISESKTNTFDQFISKLPNRYDGWKFSEFSGNTAPIVAECPICGRRHKYSTAKSFIIGQAGCKVCAGRKKLPDKDLETVLASLGWTLVERLPSRTIERSGYRTPQLKVRCVSCGCEKISSLSNLRKYQCSICSGHFDGTSGEEQEIFDWVKQFCPDAVQSDRAILKQLGKRGYELDIFIPSKKVAIEYNGRFWHSTNQIMSAKNLTYAEAKKYHHNKSAECEKQGIRLIHVWDYEWADERKQKVLKNIILGALGMLPERYFARKTTVRHYEQGCIRWQELNQFFAENNIQGNRGGSHVFTLEDDGGRILMAYKFGRPSGGRAKQKYEYEMVRGASASGVQVIGGASKLWKHAMSMLKPKSVVYYIDYNYFDGRSVEKLGGRYVGSQPGVKNYWRKTGEVKNREPAKHKEVTEAIKRGDVWELWNAGVKTYEFML